MASDYFLKQRIELVRQLAESTEVEVAYDDLALILCTVLVACAERRWQGKNIDRRRFIELVALNSGPDLDGSRVSVPSLLNSRKVDVKDTQYGKPGNALRVFTCDEVDLAYSDAVRQFPGVAEKELRKHTYAALIYERLRCPYAHQYQSGEAVNSVPATNRTGHVNYINRTVRGPVESFERRIHFDIGYLYALGSYHVASLPATPLPHPQNWWGE